MIQTDAQIVNDRIKRRISVVQKIYLVIIIFIGLGLMSNIFRQKQPGEIAESITAIAIYGLIYYGIKFKKSWVVHYTLIISAFSCFWYFLCIIYPAKSVYELFSKVIYCLLLLFFGYQLKFFRKKEINLFFKTKGQILF
jgi:hypothetical protein